MLVWCIKILLMLQLVHVMQATNSPYRIYDLIPQGICKSRRIPLLDNLLTQSDPIQLPSADWGAIFRQTWNSSSYKKYSDCKFYIQAPPRMGLYLSVSQANLRKNGRGNCMDNIVVKSNEKKYQFCESHDDDEPRVFTDDRGSMKITINLDTTVPLWTVEDTLEVQFIVTVKRKCDLEGYLPCDDDEDDSCINKAFFGDGYINCPECVDQKGCAVLLEPFPILSPSNVILSAIISLLATMVVFGGCLWCIYRNRRCIANCTSSSSAGVVRSNNDSMTAVDQVQVELHTTPADVVPSAPPDDDKDMPPSYATLFPIASSNDR